MTTSHQTPVQAEHVSVHGPLDDLLREHASCVDHDKRQGSRTANECAIQRCADMCNYTSPSETVPLSLWQLLLKVRELCHMVGADTFATGADYESMLDDAKARVIRAKLAIVATQRGQTEVIQLSPDITVTIEGPAGSGKTRVLETLRGAMRPDKVMSDVLRRIDSLPIVVADFLGDDLWPRAAQIAGGIWQEILDAQQTDAEQSVPEDKHGID